MSKQSIALICLMAGKLLGNLTELFFIPAIFFLVALALSISGLVEVYKEHKQKKQNMT